MMNGGGKSKEHSAAQIYIHVFDFSVIFAFLRNIELYCLFGLQTTV